MSATERNALWVENHARDIASRKRGLLRDCFTVGEVVEALGFSRNTVQKYVNQLEDCDKVKKIVVSKKLVIYRVLKQEVGQ